MNTPTELVVSFISDYFKWNEYVFSLSQNGKDNSAQTVALAEVKYIELLQKYCLPEFEGVSISFGSASIHDPENEVIVSEAVVDSRATIRTKHLGGLSLGAEFEYRFVKRSARWYLAAVDFVDDTGSYPSL
jgi:hypothetical protein